VADPHEIAIHRGCGRLEAARAKVTPTRTAAVTLAAMMRFLRFFFGGVGTGISMNGALSAE